MTKPATGLLLFAFALAACSPVRWHKGGGDDASLTRDLDACRKQAKERFAGLASFGSLPTNDPRFGPLGPSQADLLMQQEQAVGVCMRERGYALVPAEK